MEFIKCNDLSHCTLKATKFRCIQVPQIKDFTFSKIIKFSKEKVGIHNYLPDFEDDPTPNRVWFCNLGTNRM